MKDDYEIGVDEWIYLDEVRLAKLNLKQAVGEMSRQTHEAYLHQLVCCCWKQGDVTEMELASAAGVRLGKLKKILQDPPPPPPKLRIVR